jgi:hypothetical protein
MADEPIRTVHTFTGNLAQYLNDFTYQPELTPRLDTLSDEPFSEQTVNEIVLWKVNRYVRLSKEIRSSLYSLRSLRPNEHRMGKGVLLSLLDCQGVDLPMASAFLRFQNADVFQIIDRHAFRAVSGTPYPIRSAARPATKTSAYFKRLDEKASVYFEYLDDLVLLASSRGVQFRDLDRILYVFDKKQNPDSPIG